MPAVDITEHLKLVPFRIARCKVAKWAIKGVSTRHDDLVQAGRLGLMRAAEKYDPERGSFATYACWWIDSYLKSYCYDQLRTVRVPRNVAREAWKEGRTLPQHATSIDTGFQVMQEDGGQGVPVLDYLGYCTMQEDEQPDTDHLHARLRQAIRMMPKREAQVLYGRFFQDKTLEQLGNEFGVTRERIRQIEAKAILKLKQHFKVEA